MSHSRYGGGMGGWARGLCAGMIAARPRLTPSMTPQPLPIAQIKPSRSALSTALVRSLVWSFDRIVET